MNRRTLLSLAALALGGAAYLVVSAPVPGPAPAPPPQADDSRRHAKLIDEVLAFVLNERPDAGALIALGKEDFASLEAAAAAVVDPTDAEIDAAIAALDAADAEPRLRAVRRLLAAGETARPALVGAWHGSAAEFGPEGWRRLQTLVAELIPRYDDRGARLPEPADRLLDVMASAYRVRWGDDAAAARAVFLNERLARLLHDPHDRAARLPLLALPADTVWTHLRATSDHLRARYLLLRVSRHHADPEAARLLTQVPPADLVSAALATYWPVEVAPPRRDGSYLWTVLAREVRAGVAVRAIHLSIDTDGKGGNAAPPATWQRWVHFEPYDAVQIGDRLLPVTLPNSGWIRNAGYGRLTYDSLRNDLDSRELDVDALLRPRPPAWSR